jgi:hypothetical protein
VGASDCLALTGQSVAHDVEGASVHAIDLEINGTPVSCAIYEPGVVWARHAVAGERRPTAPVVLPPPLLGDVAGGQHLVDARTAGWERDPPQRVWRVVPAVRRPRAPAWVVGSLVHGALAGWRFPGAGFDRWAEARARGFGITDPAELGDAVRHTRRLLERFQAHPLHDELAAAGRRLHEVPYSLTVDGQVESGMIDALVERDGEWTLVEFKTDDVRDRDEFERVVAENGYREQVRRYARACERMLGTRPRCLLVMLDYGGGVRAVEVAENLAKVSEPSQG